MEESVGRRASCSPCAGYLDGVWHLLGYGADKDIIVIVGPSGVGKSTLIKKLMNDYPGRFGFSVSHTTRQPRPGEEHGIHYNFTTQDAMRDAIARGEFIEHAQVHGNVYGTSIDAVKRVVDSGRICILDIDVQGAMQVKKSSLQAKSAFMFLSPPSLAALEERLRGRGTECEEKVLLRLENARKELLFAEEEPAFFHQVLVNGDLDDTYAGFRRFMEQQCGRRRLATGEKNPPTPCFVLFSSLSPARASPFPLKKTLPTPILS